MLLQFNIEINFINREEKQKQVHTCKKRYDLFYGRYKKGIDEGGNVFSVVSGTPKWVKNIIRKIE